MGLFKTASSAGRGRPDQPSHSNIRGKISGPIPIDDDEFPIRNPGSGIAQEGLPKQLEPVTQRDSATPSANTAFNVGREDKTSSLAQSGPSQASTVSTPVRRRRTNRSSALRYSTVSEATDLESPSRKKSTLRVAFGKLFGRRNKKQSSRSVSDSEARISPSDDHHRSDPVGVKRDPPNLEAEPKRSASLPITEFNKALRSHSIGPDDYIAIHSARNSLQSDSAFLRRRAATTSGGGLSSRLRDASIDIIGLSPRPASAHGHDVVDEDPEAIGRAVSIDVLASHRRSRSLSQLPDAADGQGLVRKRSEEIRYWRESHVPGPLSPDVASSPREDHQTVEPATAPQEEMQPNTPLQPFNFGSLNIMRITQAASLEERVVALELQNQKLEKLVARLFQVVPSINNDPGAPHMAPSATSAAASLAAAGAASIQQDVPRDTDPPSSSHSMSQPSNGSFEDGQTFIGSLHPSTREAPRPISNVTIRGATSLPSLSRDASGAFTPDQYTTLKALLDAERAARQTLELRVTKLTNMVNTMSRMAHTLDKNPSSGAYGPVSVFEHDDDDDEDEDGAEPLSASIDETSDAFKTPREEYPVPDFDAFGEEPAEGEVDDGSRKRAARTLSLGQLTHKQQPGASVNL